LFPGAQAFKLNLNGMPSDHENLVGEFARACEVLCLDEYEAAEMALQDWVKKHHNEAQKRLDLYAEGGIKSKASYLSPKHATWILLSA
jgi:hypothetical protein